MAMIYTVALLAIVAAEAANLAGVEWGPAQDGVRTHLSTDGSEFVLGKPIECRLEMENVSERVVEFDSQQVAVNASMIVEKADGVSVPYIAGMTQTGGGPRLLLPGKQIVLFEALDVAEQYLFTSPGTYTVRFKGQGTASDHVAIPASNTITIRIAEGPARTSRSVARKFFDADDSFGWRLEIVKDGRVVPFGRSSGEGMTFGLTRGARTLEAPWVMVWVTQSFSPLELSTPHSEQTAQPLGRSAWGDVYWWTRNATAEEQETARKLIVATLGVEEQ